MSQGVAPRILAPSIHPSIHPPPPRPQGPLRGPLAPLVLLQGFLARNFPCARLNTISIPFSGEGGLWPPSQILAFRIYNMQTMSTISRPCFLGADGVCKLQATMNMCTNKRSFWGKEAFSHLPKYWHFVSAT